MKNSIKTLLYKLGIYDGARNIIKKIYYPYKYYRVKQSVKPILKILKEVFDKQCQDYWLDYGTLLGYVRNGQIIKNDIDLDFGIIINGNFSLQEILKEHNIYLIQRTIVEGKITLEQYNYKDIGFDIFYYRKEGEKIVTNIWFPTEYTLPQKVLYEQGNGSLSETTFSLFETEEIEFYSMPFRVPVNRDLYLKEHFGDDYMIPNPNWSYKDEKNRVNIEKEFKVEFYR
jgi:phosphorylcholine metabolism protein LicD